MSKNIVLVGAGSLQFGCDTLGDIFCTDSLKGSEIRLLDINPIALATTEKKAKNFVEEHNLSFKIKATTDRKDALKGADFIVISIEVGDRFSLWDDDWKIPLQFGVKQIYGENGGPGGLFHALRIIPPILDICADIQAICPDAFVFNFSNPMSRICTTVHRAFPDLRFIGLCHEIASMERHLPSILGIDYSDIHIKAGGLNHFSCLLEASYKKDASDAYPLILNKAGSYFKNAPCYTEYLEHYLKTGTFLLTEGSRGQSSLKAVAEWGERRVLQAILERFDLLAITTDSHFGEYIQWAHDIADHKGILDFYTYYRSILGHSDAKIKLKRKERVAVIMDGIVTDNGYEEEAVNIPNNGLIKELPDFIAVEVPATITKNGPIGIPVTVPKPFAGLLTNQIGIHDMTAEAVLGKSKKTVIQALMVDPVVNVHKNLDKLVDTMILRQSKHLGYLK